MHSLLINSENGHRRRTPEPSATDRKLTALERQRAKLVAILAIHRMSRTRRGRVRGSQPLMRSLASCGGPFTERLSCGVLLAIFRTPEAPRGRVDGECSPAGPPPLHQSGGSHDGADAKSSSSTPQSPQKNANHALVGPECIIISHGRCFEANGSETLRRLFYGGYLKLAKDI